MTLGNMRELGAPDRVCLHYASRHQALIDVFEAIQLTRRSLAPVPREVREMRWLAPFDVAISAFYRFRPVVLVSGMTP
jgi:hypothetical protein